MHSLQALHLRQALHARNISLPRLRRRRLPSAITSRLLAFVARPMLIGVAIFAASSVSVAGAAAPSNLVVNSGSASGASHGCSTGRRHTTTCSAPGTPAPTPTSTPTPSPTTPPSPAPPPAAPGGHIIVPSYISPGAGWDGIGTAAPTAAIALLNVNSGPGTAPEQNFADQVKATQAAGVAMYAYVDTAYGARSIAAVESDITTYAAWYGVHNIFFDEASTSCTAEASYYLPLYTYVHAHGGDVIINPGTATSECYMAAADIILTFEGTYADYVSAYSAPAWMKSYPAGRFYNLVYSTATAADMENAVTLSRARNIGSIYVTDLRLPNPYNALPSYWSEEVAAVGS